MHSDYIQAWDEDDLDHSRLLAQQSESFASLNLQSLLREPWQRDSEARWHGDSSSLRSLLQELEDLSSAVEGILAVGAMFLGWEGLQPAFGAMETLLAHFHLDPSSSLLMGHLSH